MLLDSEQLAALELLLRYFQRLEEGHGSSIVFKLLMNIISKKKKKEKNRIFKETFRIEQNVVITVLNQPIDN